MSLYTVHGLHFIHFQATMKNSIWYYYNKLQYNSVILLYKYYNVNNSISHLNLV